MSFGMAICRGYHSFRKGIRLLMVFGSGGVAIALTWGIVAVPAARAADIQFFEESRPCRKEAKSIDVGSVNMISLEGVLSKKDSQCYKPVRITNKWWKWHLRQSLLFMIFHDPSNISPGTLQKRAQIQLIETSLHFKWVPKQLHEPSWNRDPNISLSGAALHSVAMAYFPGTLVSINGLPSAATPVPSAAAEGVQSVDLNGDKAQLLHFDKAGGRSFRRIAGKHVRFFLGTPHGLRNMRYEKWWTFLGSNGILAGVLGC